MMSRSQAFITSVIVLSLLMVFSVTGAFAQQLVAVDSQGNIELVNPKSPGRHAAPVRPPAYIGKAGGVTFTVTFEDVGTGFNDPVLGQARRDCVQSVVDYLATLLNHQSVCEVKFMPSLNSGAYALATGGTYFTSTPGITNGVAFQHITTGTDPSASIPDIFVTVDFGNALYTGTGTPPAGQYDFRSILLHELTHGLGLMSLIEPDGSSSVGDNIYTVWDAYLQTGNGHNMIAGNPPAFAGVLNYITGGDNGLRFMGPAAAAAFGSVPPVYAPNPYQPGSSLAHWGTGVAAVMEYAIFDQVARREYSALDTGGLADVGYSIITTPAEGEPVEGELTEGFTFSQAPEGGWFKVGTDLTLTVAVESAVEPITYQWMKNGTAIDGATDAEFLKEDLLLDDTGTYKCRVTDASAKASKDSPGAYVEVYDGTLPALGLGGLAAVCGAVMLLARRRTR